MGSKRFVSMVAVLGLVVGIGTTGVAFAGGHTKPDFSKLKPIKEPSPCKNDPGITDDTIKTGVLTIQSGPQGVTFAPSTEQGIKARIDEANSSGELGKRKIELVFKDDQANQANNLTAAQQLVEEEKVFGIIEQSNVADGSAKYLNQQKIPVAGWHIGQKEWGIYPNMFSWRNSQPPDATKEFTSRNADVMQALGAKKIAVVGTNVASGAIFLNQVAQAVQKTKGLKLVYKTTDVTPEQQDFTGIAAQVKDSGADGVYTAVAGLQANALSQALKQAGVKLKAIVFPGGYDDRILSLPGYDGAYFGTEFKPLEVGIARPHEVRERDEGRRLLTGAVLRHPGLLRCRRVRRGDQGGRRRLPDAQGLHQQPAPAEGLRRRRRVHPGRPLRELRSHLLLRVLRAGSEQAVRSRLQRQATLREAALPEREGAEADQGRAGPGLAVDRD